MVSGEVSKEKLMNMRFDEAEKKLNSDTWHRSLDSQLRAHALPPIPNSFSNR